LKIILLVFGATLRPAAFIERQPIFAMTAIARNFLELLGVVV
jgi:hypothetical protein